jgi:Holliday junction resolvase RusA-like endonuclease
MNANFYYILYGEIVPKARPRSGANGRHYLPQNYRDWKDNAVRELKAQHTGTAIANPVCVDIVLMGKHSRRGDGDNIAGSIWDAMVQAGILPDDNLKHVPGLSLQLFWGKESPTALIRITTNVPLHPPAWGDRRLIQSRQNPLGCQ